MNVTRKYVRIADTLVVPAILTYFLVTFILSLPLRFYYQRTKDASAGT